MLGKISRKAPALLFIAVPVLAQDYEAEKERVLTANLRASLNRQTSPYDHPAAAEYVNRLGTQLIGSGANYTFEIVQTAAFDEPASLPGGHVLIPSHFFVHAQDASEFAAMVAHAIEHVEQRHFVARRGWTFVYFPFHTGPVPMGAREQHADLERQADGPALQRLAKAGFDPYALRRYVARNHPYDTQRAANLEERLSGMPGDPVQGADEFQKIRESVRESLPLSRTRPKPTLRRPSEVIP